MKTYSRSPPGRISAGPGIQLLRKEAIQMENNLYEKIAQLLQASCDTAIIYDSKLDNEEDMLSIQTDMLDAFIEALAAVKNVPVEEVNKFIIKRLIFE